MAMVNGKKERISAPVIHIGLVGKIENKLTGKFFYPYR